MAKVYNKEGINSMEIDGAIVKCYCPNSGSRTRT